MFRIIICFQGWYEGTIEGLGSSVGHSRSREQQQYTSIPDWLWRHNESSIIDARRPNHDEVHLMTSMDHFRRKWIAVYPLHALVLGVTQHQAIEQCKTALALRRLLQFQGFEESINLWYNMYKMYNAYNSKWNQNYLQGFPDLMVITTIRTRTKVSIP